VTRSAFATLRRSYRIARFLDRAATEASYLAATDPMRDRFVRWSICHAHVDAVVAPLSWPIRNVVVDTPANDGVRSVQLANRANYNAIKRNARLAIADSRRRIDAMLAERALAVAA
jgi:hypothetical protein